tara:strand:+ start:3173 stop:3787 length:615 start_codon:yes stop_codon:yes gene_type:complete
MDNFEIIKPFGPSIVKIKMSSEMISEINNYVDLIIQDNEKSKNLDEGKNLIGKVQQEFLMEVDFMKKIKWAEFLASAVSKWVLKEQNKKIKNFQLIKSWIVRQFQNDYNPVHYHSGHISGAGYLKVPSNLGMTTQVDKTTNENGKLQLIYGSPNLLSKSTHIIKPEVGDFYLFPNYLMHTVYPFNGTDEERRSVSFNAKLEFIN